MTGEGGAGGPSVRLWRRAWYGPVASVRPWLLERCVLVALAFDCWLLMAHSGGRYGAGGFNVAHFEWLGAIQPLPSPPLYVAVILLCGFLALLGAAGVAGRIGVGLLALLYTWGWAMSQLDSYQHHYFLTWVLLAMAVTPHRPLGEVIGDEEGPGQRDAVGFGLLVATAALVVLSYLFVDDVLAAFLLGVGVVLLARRAWADDERPPERGATGFRLLVATCAFVYFWAGVSKAIKLDAQHEVSWSTQWLDGHVLQRISAGAGGRLEPFRELASQLGLADATFWKLCGHSVVLVQIAIAGCFVAWLLQRNPRSLLVGVLRGAGWAAAVSFHVGAEYLKLQIGWFSWYMIALDSLILLPASWFHVATVWATWPWRALLARLDDERGRTRAAAWRAFAMLLVAGGLCAFVGPALDLPGGTWACALAGALVLLLGLEGYRRRGARGVLACALAGALAGGALWLSVTKTSVRWDYYRYVGGDAMRRGDIRRSIRVYGKAETYSPPDETRRDKVRKLLRQMSESDG